MPAAIDATEGVTEIAVTTAGVTVKVAEPLIVPEVAVIDVVPTATLPASPALTVATPEGKEFQVTELVRS